MRIGDIDGKGIIYDMNGEPILEEYEKVVLKLDGECCVDFKMNDELLYRDVFMYGRGNIILTNKRFIFIREPLSPSEIMKMAGRGIGGGYKLCLKANRIKEAKGKEYFALYLDEISKIEIPLIAACSYIHVWKKDKKYGIAVPKEVGRNLRKLVDLND
jgi:hypothetical protein